MTVILGAISSLATELVVPGTYHFILLKSYMPSQVSSMLRKIFCFLSSARNSSAQRYLRIRFFSEFEWSETYLIFR